MEEIVDDGKERKKKHKHKKKKKHKHEDKEEILETKLNNIDLPPNIPSDPNLFAKNSERGLLPKFKIPEDSDTGTDNAMQGVLKTSSRLSGVSRSRSNERGDSSPRTRAWRPRFKDDTTDDDKPRQTQSLSPRNRFSTEIVDIAEMSSEDSEANSRRSFQKLKRKKKNKRSLRNLSDSDGI